MKKTSLYIFLSTLAISLTLWIIAATLPAYIVGTESYNGMTCFIMGLMIFPVLYNPFILVAWSGNALAAVSLVLLSRKKYIKGVKFAIAAVLTSLFALSITTLPTDENSGISTPATFGPGLDLWLASIGVVLIGHIVAISVSSIKHRK